MLCLRLSGLVALLLADVAVTFVFLWSAEHLLRVVVAGVCDGGQCRPAISGQPRCSTAAFLIHARHLPVCARSRCVRVVLNSVVYGVQCESISGGGGANGRVLCQCHRVGGRVTGVLAVPFKFVMLFRPSRWSLYTKNCCGVALLHCSLSCSGDCYYHRHRIGQGRAVTRTGPDTRRRRCHPGCTLTKALTRPRLLVRQGATWMTSHWQCACVYVQVRATRRRLSCHLFPVHFFGSRGRAAPS